MHLDNMILLFKKKKKKNKREIFHYTGDRDRLEAAVY